jgi:sRNA-binding carbon storage regulator CsrA
MAQEMSRLTIDVRPGELIKLSGSVSIELIQKSGRVARLRVTAPQDVQIKKEVSDACEFRGKHGAIAP